ncbi:DUF983 domain-containing protein [Caulobacter sp. 17J80-11]|uniref:DUF983 domain-containing protein n=1 Tax=Caulobacter sp. 17J80-11 TaxID=2763502 RepID=UPI001653E964|nr:DUF983 domain-containing protein [Caulobacter sp. 17J80-11]MBC6983443.1 DUF983 domain-containing protein [Caulobacter sp. 17J80-11]
MTRSLLTGLKRGLKHRCPNCGEGRLFTGYLKVRGTCEACGHENGRYPADDAPPYFTILIVGHLFIAPVLLFDFVWTASPVLVVGTVVPALAVVTLTLLPFVKGAVVGAHWATGTVKPLQ